MNTISARGSSSLWITGDPDAMTGFTQPFLNWKFTSTENVFLQNRAIILYLVYSFGCTDLF